MAAPGILDPTKPGQYPVVLSDELLGKASKGTYSGIRYNHRPTLSSDAAPSTARLKKSAKDESYNLGFDDQGDKYQYNGVRTTDDGNFILIFDPARKVFVLHRVDSTFHMNITRTPSDSNVESLRKQFPQLEVKAASTQKLPKRKTPADKASASASASNVTPTVTATATAKGTGAGTKPKDARKPAEDTPKKKNKAVELTLPDLTLPMPTVQKKPPPPPPAPGKKSKRPALSPVESEEEDDDDDGGLTIEYPEGNPAALRGSQYPPPFPVAVTRRFSEFARDIEDEDEFDNNNNNNRGYGGGFQDQGGYDEDGEGYDEEEEEAPRPPPSPPRPARVELPPAVEPDRYTFDTGDDDSDGAGMDDGDLEAELAREFLAGDDAGHESDSSVSEEE